MRAKKMMTIGLSCMVVTAAAGCFKHSYTVGAGGNVNADPNLDKWESHWLFGLIGESDVDVKRVCPSGNATVKDKISFLNGLIGSIIGAIWYPTTVEVYCREGGKAATLHLRPEQLRNVALRPETMQWAQAVSSVRAAELEDALRTYRETHKNVATTAPGPTL